MPMPLAPRAGSRKPCGSTLTTASAVSRVSSCRTATSTSWRIRSSTNAAVSARPPQRFADRIRSGRCAVLLKILQVEMDRRKARPVKRMRKSCCPQAGVSPLPPRRLFREPVSLTATGSLSRPPAISASRRARWAPDSECLAAVPAVAIAGFDLRSVRRAGDYREMSLRAASDG